MKHDTTPYAEHAEAFVLAAALQTRWFDDIAQLLPSAEMFYSQRHRAMYEAITALHLVGRGIDATSLSAELRRAEAIGAGPSQWSTEAIERFARETPREMLNYATHAEEVRTQWMRREIIRTSKESQIAALDQAADAHDALDLAQSELARIAESATRSSPPDIRTVANRAIELIAENRRRHCDGRIIGVPSGIHALDSKTYGWVAPRYVIVGARTSIGKTAFLFTNVANALESGHGCAIYSWEEAPESLFIRLAAIRAVVNSQRAVNGALNATEQADLDKAMEELRTMPLEIIDAGGWSSLDVRAHARSLKRRMPTLSLVGIDYVQKVRPVDARKDVRLQIRETSNTLFRFAHDTKLVVLCLAQLNRQAQGRADKRPEQSDLKEAGNLEEDADSILLIHRPEYDGIDTWFDTGLSCVNQAKLLLTKHRGGATAPNGILVAYHKERGEFADVDPDPHTPDVLPFNSAARYDRDW